MPVGAPLRCGASLSPRAFGGALRDSLRVPSPLVQLAMSRAPTPRSASPPLVLVDGNNVRGVGMFALSQSELALRCSAWAASQRLPLIVTLDHGTRHRAWRLGSYAAVSLSGPRNVQKADDLIVRDAYWCCAHGTDALVVTSDEQLRTRLEVFDRPPPGMALPGTGLVRLVTSHSILPFILGDCASILGECSSSSGDPGASRGESIPSSLGDRGPQMEGGAQIEGRIRRRGSLMGESRGRGMRRGKSRGKSRGETTSQRERAARRLEQHLDGDRYGSSGGGQDVEGGGEEYLDGHLDRSGSGGGQNVERGSGEGVDVAAEADAILSRYVDWARSEEGQRPAESVVPRRLYFDLGHPSRAPSGVVRGPKGKLRRVAR